MYFATVTLKFVSIQPQKGPTVDKQEEQCKYEYENEDKDEGEDKQGNDELEEDQDEEGQIQAVAADMVGERIQDELPDSLCHVFLPMGICISKWHPYRFAKVLN